MGWGANQKTFYDRGMDIFWTGNPMKNKIEIQCFFAVISQILRVLNESAVAIRTKAMKSLSAVISADPSILSRVSEALNSPTIQLALY